MNEHKGYHIAWYFVFHNRPSSMISIENASTLYWKYLATNTGLLFNRYHRSWKLEFSSSSSLTPRFFNLLIIHESSYYLKSAHDNVRKYVGSPNYLSIASISYRNCPQYAGVTLTQLINENPLSLASNLSNVPLELFLIVLAVICFRFTFVLSKAYWWT